MTAAEQQGRADGATLRLRLPRRPLAGAAGERLGSRAGESLEFHDYRDYAPGDDLRNLDWNVLARTDREMVKVRREEIAPVVELFADRSVSMTVPAAKTAAADHFAGLVAAAAGDCRVTVRPFANGLATEIGPLRPRSLRIVVSDLLLAADPDALLASFGRDAAALAVIRILSRDEREIPAAGAAELIDAETRERRIVTFSPALRDDYRMRLAVHTSRWLAACRRHAAAFVDLTAEDDVRARLDALLAAGLVEVRR